MTRQFEWVYHGSPTRSFWVAEPKQNIRTRTEGNVEVEIFNELSFHATPASWIALAYTYHSKHWAHNGKLGRYNMGVDLYGENKEVAIFGIESLEHSLNEMYGDGGYLYVFDKEQFFWKEGLGTREVITNITARPVSIEKVRDPVRKMREEGVEFVFFDER